MNSKYLLQTTAEHALSCSHLTYPYGMNESLVMSTLGLIIRRAQKFSVSLPLNVQLHVNRLEVCLDLRKRLDQSFSGSVGNAMMFA